MWNYCILMFQNSIQILKLIFDCDLNSFLRFYFETAQLSKPWCCMIHSYLLINCIRSVTPYLVQSFRTLSYVLFTQTVGHYHWITNEKFGWLLRFTQNGYSKYRSSQTFQHFLHVHVGFFMALTNRAFDVCGAMSSEDGRLWRVRAEKETEVWQANWCQCNSRLSWFWRRSGYSFWSQVISISSFEEKLHYFRERNAE